MMRRLRFCCEGVDIVKLAAVEQNEKKVTVQHKTEPWGKGNNDATVIPPKRKCVKNTVCNCFVQCICAKCCNTNTLSPPTPIITSGNQFISIFYLFWYQLSV